MSFESQFLAFLSHFRTLVSSLSLHLRSIPAQSSRASQDTLLRQCAQTSAEAQESIAQITPIVASLSSTVARQRATAQLTECKRQLATATQIQQSYIKQATRSTIKRLVDNSALVSEEQRAEENAARERQLLLDARQSLDSGNESLAQTERLLAESYESGSSTSLTLAQQREQFERQRARLEDTNSLLVRTKQSLRRLRMKLHLSRFQTLVIVVLQLFLIAILSWWRYHN